MRSTLVVASVFFPLLAACPRGPTLIREEVEVPSPWVRVSGDGTLERGERSQLVAETVGGDDSEYAWTSLDPSVAEVDESGLVTGKSPGETEIIVIGVQSSGEGRRPIVVVGEVPMLEAWQGSAHADVTAAAFNHWNDDGAVPESCARCHSASGFVDYLGGDGSPAGVVDAAAPIREVIGCTACHNEAARTLESVTFPSGTVVGGLGGEARCMTCHQGRSSTLSVDEAVAAAALPGDDARSAALSLVSPHYLPSAATLYGGIAFGGYQYQDKSYDTRLAHVEGKQSCIQCHDPHSLEVKVASCSSCHAGVDDRADLVGIRMRGSTVDYDGDGNTSEGMALELDGLEDRLYTAIKSYASAVSNRPIVHAAAYPYFFHDGDGDGVADVEEQLYANRYQSFTPRLLRAAYNYLFAKNDDGAYAHGGKYVVQLLFDSIEDLNRVLPVPVVTGSRLDHVHLSGAKEPFRHWDGDGAVPATCSRCHSAKGVPTREQHGVDLEQPPANGLMCSTCHASEQTFALRAFASVDFPGGAVVDFDDEVTNLCAQCHRGREGKGTIDAALAAGNVAFRNVHYLGAGATLAGSEGRVGYEYDGREYATRFLHYGGQSNACNTCHDLGEQHSFRPTLKEGCLDCHAEATAGLHEIRKDRPLDYDGDGSTVEPLEDEVATLTAALYERIRAAGAAAGTPIGYHGDAYPYFFTDLDDDGVIDESEASYANRYQAWTPALVKAAHNFQMAKKDPGSWGHNFDYTAQLLIDSVEDLGGDVSLFVRPAP